MSKLKICMNCTYNNNGWCNKRKTNKGLKDCEFRKISNLNRLENYLEQKRFELQIENNSFARGIIKGLEIALMIMEDK